jgi:hypothetical protein
MFKRRVGTMLAWEGNPSYKCLNWSTKWSTITTE